jgi:hypothetical protein
MQHVPAATGNRQLSAIPIPYLANGICVRINMKPILGKTSHSLTYVHRLGFSQGLKILNVFEPKILQVLQKYVKCW